MTKNQWRARLLAARQARSAEATARARDLIAAHLVAAFGPAGQVGAAAGDTVCVYVPLPSEPLAPQVPALLQAWGLRVLAPVATRGEPLDWCELPPSPGDGHPGPSLTRGMLGVAEPTGPRLGPAAIRTATAVLLPALAVDARGIRLGRGGGHYDRSLALIDPAAGIQLLAVLFDDEMLGVADGVLPREGHDRPVTAVVTPSGGVRSVANTAPPRLANPGAPGALSS